MGNTKSGPDEAACGETTPASNQASQSNFKRGQSLNVHEAQHDIKIHSTVSFGLDCDHDTAMKLPLGEVFIIYFN